MHPFLSVPFLAAAFGLLAVLPLVASAGAPLDFEPPKRVSMLETSWDVGEDLSPQLTTDGLGNWIAVWESDDPLDGAIDSDSDILFARSENGGFSWSAPAPLNSNAGTDDGSDIGPQLTTDGQGTWIAVWSSRDPLSEGPSDEGIGWDSDILYAHSSDAGVTWSAPQPLNTNAFDDEVGDRAPQLATDGAGTWVAIWESAPTDWGPARSILFSRSLNGGLSWSEPAALHEYASEGPGENHSPQLTTDGQGNWLAVWVSTHYFGNLDSDEDILFSRSTDGGATWTVPALVEAGATGPGPNDHSPQLTTDRAGTWIAVWVSTGITGPDEDIAFSRSFDAGATWSEPQSLNSDAGDDGDYDGQGKRDYQPQLTTDGAGTWIATWISMESVAGSFWPEPVLYYARSTDDGHTWTPRAALRQGTDGPAYGDLDPQITTDGAGRWVAVWASYDTLGCSIGWDADILFSRSSDAGETWSSAGPLNRNAGHADHETLSPAIATDGTGTWIAAWGGGSLNTSCDGFDMGMQFARSEDDGRTWTRLSFDGSPPSTSPGEGEYYGAEIAADGAGNWIAIWDYAHYEVGLQGIYFSRSTDGGLTWSEARALNEDHASWIESMPHIASDGNGAWVATWEATQWEDGVPWQFWSRKVMAARSTDGGLTWSEPVVLSSPDHHGLTPRVASDREQSWMIVWQQRAEYGKTPDKVGIVTSRSDNGGLTWSQPTLLHANGELPDVAADEGRNGAPGNFLVIWSEWSIGVGYSRYIQDVDLGRVWTAPAYLTDHGPSDRARIATDRKGEWVIAWNSDILNWTDSGYYSDEEDVFYSRSENVGATWTAPAIVNTDAETDAWRRDRDPALAVGANGTRIVAWWENPDEGVPAFITTARAGGPNTCGDGVVGGAEACDDGGVENGDCCSSDCQFEPRGSACQADDSLCTQDVCDGAGTCGVEEPLPFDECLVAPKTTLEMQVPAGKPARNKLAWQWIAGDGFDRDALAMPTVDTDYVLCIYDTISDVPALVAEVKAGASDTLWTDLGRKGLVYRDATGSSDGVVRVRIRTGAEKRTKVSFLAKGERLPLVPSLADPYFAQDPAVLAQLVHSDGTCWASGFDQGHVKRHDSQSFVARTVHGFGGPPISGTAR